MSQTDDAYDVAERLLRDANSEEDARAAASRAYFAAFQHALIHPAVVSAGYRRSNDGREHQNLIRFLKNSGAARLETAGLGLGRLRDLRNIADYNRDIGFTREMAEDALERAYEIIYEALG